MRILSFAIAVALTSLLASCGGYEAHEAQLNSRVADALKLASADRKCMQIDEYAWQLPGLGLTVYGSQAYDEDIKGFAGPTHVFIVVDAEDKITLVVPDENAESPEFFERLAQADYFSRWNGMTLAQAAEQEVDAVSGATYSSRGIAETIKATAKALK